MTLKDLIFIIKPLSFKEALEYIIKNAQTDNKKMFVVTINPEIIMLAGNDKEYEKILKSADLALADGIGAVFAAKIFGKSLKRRVQGSDLIEKVCEEVSKQPITVGFLGGKENVAEKTAECLKLKYPGLNVVFAAEEWLGLEADNRKVLSSKYQVSSIKEKILNTKYLIPNTTIDILFVAFGPPKQETWIYKNLPNIDVKVAIGVGGAFDFISGRIPRAPVWIRKVGFEWLFRLIIQPWRWRRQLALPRFVMLVLKERFFSNRI